MTAQHAAPKARPHQKKKRILTLAALALLAAAAVAGTLAFSTRSREAENVISFGSVKMLLLETELSGDTEIPVDAEQSVKAASGKVSRIVRVRNVGANDMYVRVRPAMVVESAAGEGREASSGVYELTMNEGAGAAQWTQGDDGWWYYNSPLAADAEGAGETSGPLMTSVEFVGDFFDEAGPGGSFKLTLDAQAVQVEHNKGTALEATGWPEATSQGGEGQE